MSSIPIISQLKSLVQVCTGDADAAKKTQEEFLDAWKNHPLKTAGDFADGIPVVGHVKGIVHLAMGDKEAAIHSEESASRTLVVMAAGAATAASGGLAAPILAGVVAGVAADGVLTGIESLRHDHYDPQGIIGVGTNVYNDISKSETSGKISGDVFDGIVIAATDGYVGTSSVAQPKKTTTIYRVEGKSLIDFNNTYKAGDNARIMHYERGDSVHVRNKLGLPEDPETLGPNYKPPPLNPEEANVPPPSGISGAPLGVTTDFTNLFTDDAFKCNDVHLNFGNEDRVYGYYAQKVINHRELVTKYKESLNGNPTGVTNATHQIQVKSFEVLTRDVELLEQAAIEESQAQAADATGIYRVDVKHPKQYGLKKGRYIPLFQKYVKGTFRAKSLWIKDLPTPILELINKYPVQFGKVRRLKMNKSFWASSALSGPVENAGEDFMLRVDQLRQLTVEQAAHVTSIDAVPLTVAHSRHVKMIPQEKEGDYEWYEHMEYLVKFSENEPAEWYPEELMSEGLMWEFYDRAKASSKPVSAFVGREGDKLLVERPDGTVDKIAEYQIFWDALAEGARELHPNEIDSVLYHIHRDDDHPGGRIRLATTDPFPSATVTHAPPCLDGPDANTLHPTLGQRSTSRATPYRVKSCPIWLRRTLYVLCRILERRSLIMEATTCFLSSQIQWSL